MVDILLATHNSEQYLAQMLDSLLAQTFRDFRIIVSDDGSTDGTQKILQEYAGQHENITILKNDLPLGGAKQNFFHLCVHSGAEYAMFADHDDIWYPDKIASTIKLMREMEAKYGCQTPILVHTDLEVVDEQLHTIAPSMMHAQNLSKTFATVNKFLPQNHVTGCTVMVNNALIKKVKHLSLEPIVMHDWWLALIASAFGRIGFLDRPTIKYRQHAANEIGTKVVRSAEYFVDNLSDTQQLKDRIKDTYLQAEAFYQTYKEDLSPENQKIVRAYAEFIHLNKFRKWARMIRFGFFKKGFVRKIGQLLLG